MLPLDVIRKYYPNLSDEELKEIQEIVYLLACAVMQHVYGHDWMNYSGDLEQEEEKQT